MPGMPPESWWLAPVVLFLLGTLAMVDAFTARVPDPIVLPSLLFVTGVQGFYMGFPWAGMQLLTAFAAGFVIYLANEAWFRVTRRDALGMGDAKWTVLAVSCFGILAPGIAWGVGAWLGLAWLGIARLARHPIRRVHFAPFLFVGLIAGIWFLRLR